jgi:hypothetical protein
MALHVRHDANTAESSPNQCICCMVLLALAVAVAGPVTTGTPIGGNLPGQQLNDWSLNCPPGTWVFGIDIAGDPAITALGPIYCTSGDNKGVTTVGTLQGKLPDPVTKWREYDGSTGYSDIAVRRLDLGGSVGSLIDTISFTQGSDPKQTGDGRSVNPGQQAQWYGGKSGGERLRSSCPEGSIITGLFGQSNCCNNLTVGSRCQSVTRK